MKRGVAEAAQIVGVGKEQIKVWSRLFREYLNKDASPAVVSGIMRTLGNL